MAPERPDDPSVTDDELLWRRVHPTQMILRDGAWRAQSGAFIDRNTKELSVDRAKLASLEAIVDAHPDHSVVQFEAASPRALGYRVCADPLPHNPAHAVVAPMMTPAHARQMATEHARVIRQGRIPQATS